MTNNYLLTHGHIVVDEYREYLDGSLIIKDGYIEKVEPQSYIDNLDGYESINLNGNLIFPGFITINHKADSSKGITKEFNANVFDPYCEKMKEGINLIGKTSLRHQDLDNYKYDGLYDVLHNGDFNPYDFGLINSALVLKDKYIVIIDDLPKEMLALLIHNIDMNHLIVLSDDYGETFRKLKDIKTHYNEMLMITSLNVSRLYQEDKTNGSLIKGKEANVVVMNEQFNIEYTFIKGTLEYAKNSH